MTTMNDNSSNNAMPQTEQLVAYLDGELDPESSRRIEELLATDAEVRCRVQELERTWNLLDDLDTAPVDGHFTQSTLEMVAVAASGDAEESLAEAPRRRRRRLLAVGGSLLAAVLAGFLATVLLWPDPNRQLVQDLPVLENLDEYRPIGDIEFLHLLSDARLFLKDDGDAPAAEAVPSDESLAQRRLRIESMSPGEKQGILRLRERFVALDGEQQQRLRRLDKSLQEDADTAQLRQIMRRYCEWLKSLPSFTRAELADLTPADRVKSVEKRLQEENRAGVRRLGERDSEAFMRWIKESVARHEKQLLEMLPQQQRKKATELTPQMLQRMLSLQMLEQWQKAGPGKPPPLMTDDDLARLRGELSPKMRTRLESKPTAEQWKVVADWLGHVARRRPMHGPLPRPDDERLADFFEKELTDQERGRLLDMPIGEMQRALLGMYWARTKPAEGPGHRPDGRKHDKWPGAESRPALDEKR
jgi:hypothetical protein